MPRQLVGQVTYGNALSLSSASSQYAYCVRASNATNNFTWSFWLKVASLPASNQYILMNGDNNGHDGYRIRLGTTGLVALDMIFVDASCITSTPISLNTWTHFIIERDSGTSTIYINGVANGATSASTPNTINADATTSVGVSGTKGTPPTSLSGYLNGELDDLRIYDRALTGAERTALYNYGVNINNPDISNASLKGWWKFNESSGNPQDSSGNGKHLTAINTPTFTTGKVQLSNISARTAAGRRQLARNFGTCLNFAAAADRVTFADSSSLDLTTTLTISAWIKPISYGISTSVARIVDKDAGNATSFVFMLKNDNGAKTLQVLFDNSVLVSSSSNIIQLGVWQHVAMTWDKDAGSNEIKFYVNGVAAGTASRSTAISANAQNLCIGNRNGGDRTFDGKIDEVKIYNRALTLAEIQNEYYGSNQSTSGLVLYTKFDEGSGTTANDSSSTQSAGTITGATYSTDVFIKNRTAA